MTEQKKEDDGFIKLTDTDYKFNPDVHIFNAIHAAQRALTKDNIAEGFIQYRVIIEHLEVLARPAKLLPDDYDEEIKKFKDSDEYKQEDKDMARSVKLASKKLGLIMKSVFERKPITEALKL
jgi:hypothetical protein